jgi:hypothetical protein
MANPARKDCAGEADRRIGRSGDPCIGNLKIAGDVAERVGEIGADRSHDSDCRNRDQRRDQPVFDRRNPALVFDQAENSRVFEAIVVEALSLCVRGHKML